MTLSRVEAARSRTDMPIKHHMLIDITWYWFRKIVLGIDTFMLISFSLHVTWLLQRGSIYNDAYGYNYHGTTECILNDWYLPSIQGMHISIRDVKNQYLGLKTSSNISLLQELYYQMHHWPFDLPHVPYPLCWFSVLENLFTHVILFTLLRRHKHIRIVCVLKQH